MLLRKKEKQQQRMSVGGEKSGQRWPLWGGTFNEKSEPSEVMDRVPKNRKHKFRW